LIATSETLTIKDRIYQKGRMQGAKHYLAWLEKKHQQANPQSYYWQLYRLLNKVERLRSGSQWETFFGTNGDDKVFNDYIRALGH
jgi:hypothetical protein